MEKYDVLDWQSFSEKKDIEEIAKNTKDKNEIQITAAIEIAMGVSSIVSDTIFCGKVLVVVSWITLAISLIPLIWLGIKYSIRFYNRKKRGNDIPNVSSLINLFDNEICYYAMMAESYTNKLDNLDDNIPFSVKQFYFIETCFYINKAIYNLSLTSNCKDKLYSTDKKKLHQNRNISYTRLKNIFDILDLCISRLTNEFNTISNIDINKNYEELCLQYKDQYNTFKKLFISIDSNLKFK